MTNTSNKVNTHNGHKFVDLGLPSGTLWATRNVGARTPKDKGLYFAWGETEGYSADQVENVVRNFYSSEYEAGSAASISTDLTLEQDAAHAYMGGNWRMPTKDEWKELFDYCDVVWTTYGRTRVFGKLFTSKVNGNSVFLPAAGGCDDSSVFLTSSDGYYWAASWDSSSLAYLLNFYSGDQLVRIDYRYHGYSVRGVCKR